MDQPIHLGFAMLELSKLLVYETFYKRLQPYFGGKLIECPYLDTNSFVLSVNSSNFIKILKNVEDLFDFSNWSENHELFSNKNTK